MDQEQGWRTAEALKKDFAALWDHAQRGLVVALLRKAYPTNPKVQDQILVHFGEYLDGLLDGDYLRWRKGNSNGNVEDFLTQCPPFALPSPGDLRKSRGPSRLARATQDYRSLLACLKERLKRSYRNDNARKQAIKRVLEEVFGTTYRVPEEKWAEWAGDGSSRKQTHQIALEATALKYGLRASSLKRHKVPRYKRSEMQEGLKEAERTGHPARDEIYQKVQTLQAMLVSSRS